MADEVVIAVEGRIGRIRLNRPKALHALTHAMCVAMSDALLAWRTDDAVEAVLIDHRPAPDGDPKGARGFCAGGDVRAAAASVAADGGIEARRFFFDEYRLNHLLFTYAKPVGAFMDGVVMGGGVGIACPARHRIATERTVLAMPEATIGLFPDVGGGWYLARLPGRIGQYLALTAARLDGADCCALGLATHYLPSATLEAVKARIAEQPGDLPAFLADAAIDPPPAPILARRGEIDRLFASNRLEEIVAACAGSDYEAALAAKSPQSMKVALALLARSPRLTEFADEMRMEYGVVVHIVQRPDFAEGVRALLIDKDNAPRWDPGTPEGVTDHMIDTIFAPLPEAEAWEPLRL